MGKVYRTPLNGNECETNGRSVVENAETTSGRLEDYENRRGDDSSSSSSSEEDSFPIRLQNSNTRLVDAALINLFLPKKVPDKAQGDLPNVEEWILSQVTNLLQEEGTPPFLRNLTKMLYVWKSLQPISSSDQERFILRFRYEVENMEIGDSIPIYIREQNCSIIISKLPDNLMRVETFRPSLSSEAIMSTMGSIKVRFPETSNVIHSVELLTSDAFSKQLHELAVDKFEISMQTTNKADQDFLEYREVSEPFLVTDWVIGLLVPASHHTAKKLSVEKKIRDEVICKQSAYAVPFRRSGMWTSIKVAIHLKLLQVMGNETTAKIVYKIIILHVLAEVSRKYSESPNPRGIDADLVSQMLAKLGRRLKKLMKMGYDKDSIYSQQIKDMYSSCRNVVYKVNTKLHFQMSQAVSPTFPDKVMEPITRSAEEFQKDLLHTIPWLDDYIEQELNARRQSSEASEMLNFTAENLSASLQIRRYSNLDTILAHSKHLKSCSKSENTKKRIWLHDTETFMKFQLDNNPDLESKRIVELIKTYIKVAFPHYNANGDPLGYSQMLLAILKAIQVLDKKAVKTYPLLKQYESGIHAIKFDKLLLPHAQDMKLLGEIMEYFRKRDDVAYHPGILDSLEITESSFCVRFAAENKDMIELRTKILSDTVLRIANKKAEVETARARCVEFQRKLEQRKTECLNCKYDENKIKTDMCEKCAYFANKLKETRLSVSVYERPLPKEEFFQQAVIFELLIPSELLFLREGLAILKFDLFGESKFKSKKYQVQWLNYKHLLEYVKTGGPDTMVNLYSVQLPTSHTHYALISNLDLMSPETTNEDFVVHNGLDCVYQYTYELSTSPAKGDHEYMCSFQLESTARSENDIYGNLQWAINGTNHTQNRILAEFGSTLYPDIVAFGTLRAGHRIQLLNLYRFISNRELCLEKEAVLALILQTLWQTGPRDQHENRESHLDFLEENSEFGKEFLLLLGKLIKTNDTNYANPMILLTAVCITLRILELNQNQDSRNKCYELLLKARRYASIWMEKINQEISTVHNDDAVSNMSGQSTDLNAIQLQIAICSALTFSISESTLCEAVIRDEKDLCCWFEALSTIYQLTEQGSCENSCSPFVNILLNAARNVALNLCLETKLATHSLVGKALDLFSRKKWDKAGELVKKDEGDSGWKFSPTNPNLLVADYVENSSGDEHFLSFDLLLGTFLVNGYPQSSLPHSLLHDPLFELYFGESRTKIKIQGYQAKRIRTVQKFHGKHYEFETDSSSGSLIIREIQEGATKFDLLRPEKFRGFIGDDLVDYYTHWIDIDSKIVYFKRTPLQESDYSLPHEFILIKQENGVMWMLYNETLDHFILNRKSEGFLKIAGTFSNLEMEKYLNVFMNEKTGLVSAQLPRYNLNFNLIQDQLCSIEYAGFRISLDQNLRETLIGLQQGLRLETNVEEHLKNESVVKKWLIVPHGKLNHFQEKRHSCSKVSVDHLRQPPFFVYEFDEVLKRVKADKSKASWLYLAALHAATTLPIPDPFTGLTGTEAAVQILQSGFVWSCSPYDEECLTTLKLIKRFSPKRYYYGTGLPQSLNKMGNPVEQIENTQWPPGISPIAAFDGYSIIVDKLLEDSYRLASLYPGTPAREKEWDRSSYKLQIRAYYRHLGAYNKAAIVKPNYFITSAKPFQEKFNVMEINCRRKDISGDYNLESLQFVAQLRFMNKLQHVDSNRRKSFLSSFLLTEDMLPPLPLPRLNSVALKDLLDLQFTKNWLKFYVMASTWKEKRQRQWFTVILSALAYLGAPNEQILNLHNISVLINESPLVFPKVPASFSESKYELSDLTAHSLDREKVKFFLSERVIPIGYKNGHSLDRLKAQKYKAEVEDKIDYILDQLEGIWPCGRIPEDKMDQIFVHAQFWSYEDINQINSMMAGWYQNHQLKEFVEKVERILDTVYGKLPLELNNPYRFDSMEPITSDLIVLPPDLNYGGPEQYFDDYKGLVINENLEEAALIFFSGRALETNVENELASFREQCVSKIKSYLKRITNSVAGEAQTKQILLMSGIAPRTAPVLLLQYLLHGLRTGSADKGLLKIVGALGVLWSELKRFNRCLVLKSKASLGSELKKELENLGRDNWNPRDHPEWLLLELELDIMIRPIQVEVAKQMMCMPNGKNGVMQLNMGEGKTTVIIPMIASVLAGEKSLCRVTVLTSIFKMNLNILSFAMGGLLNRRVYTFPCRRDMEIDDTCSDMILEAYKECLNYKGVVLTLPEYTLSFRMMAYDKTLKSNPALGVKLLKIENGLIKYARDIMDESDELFNVKYQLVYTIGSQVPVDGGKLRWITCQKLLRKVQAIAVPFLEKVGSKSVECQKEHLEAHPEQFAYFRLLEKTVEDEFKSMLANEVLKEFKNTEREKQIIKKYLTQEKISRENFNEVISLFKNDSIHLDEIRLLSGYFNRGILTLALSKRWRVEYGVDPRGHRRMAVPFRAKDYAAERTEFGHPDLAIVLTHLSYYYSGLSNSQLQECFNVLKGRPEANKIYEAWLEKFPSEKIPKFLASYSSLNLHDHYQASQLFELMRKHKSTIDYWLSHKVFPKESKQFPGKIVMTAWDLCTERSQQPISGFSGTNDSSILLPLPICQQDLKQLEDTNIKMEQTLLKPVNGNHKGFRMGVTCREILEEMKKDKLTVLIDAGALMLECDNEAVAQLWLQTDSQIEAVVYFTRDNEPLVKCRSEHHGDGERQKKLLRYSLQRERVRDLPLEVSPYRERLERCGVFLDDQHTRGTDFKFPVGSKAVVTVGTRMRREKLVQACMRMRKLADGGHTVTFYLSNEAYNKTLTMKPEENNDVVTTKDVINWVTENTKEFNEDGLLFWALSARNYAQKLAANEFFDSVDTDQLEKIQTLAKQLVEEEVLLLKDIYGTYTEMQLVTKLIPCWFEIVQKKLQNVEGCYMLSQRIVMKLESIRDKVLERCLKYISKKTRITGLNLLEEQQEKELEKYSELEVEEQRKVVLPKMDEAKAHLDEDVKKCIILGQLNPEAVLRLPQIFEKSSLWKLIQPECWGNDVFATKDFATVIKSYDNVNDTVKSDSYLRPIEYLVSFKQPTTTSSSSSSTLKILIVSPFEVNQLLPYFRKGKAVSQLHMFSARSYQNQPILINNPTLQIPRSHLRPSVYIPEDGKAMAQLLLASGNLYFTTMEEQVTFARFLGYVPRPWTTEQAKAFENEMIKKSGFLLPKYRKQTKANCFIELSVFQKDPIGMVKKICMARNVVISNLSHVSQLLNNNLYVELP